MNNERDGSSLSRAIIVRGEEERKEIESRLMLPRDNNGRSVLTPTKSRHFLDASGNQTTVQFELTLNDEQWKVVELAFTMDNEVCLLQERSGNEIVRVLNQVMQVMNEWTGADRDYRTRVVLKTDPDYNQYPWWTLEPFYSQDHGMTVEKLSIDGLLTALRILLLCYIPSEGGFNADGVEEYKSLVECSNEKTALALYRLRQYVYNVTRKYYVETIEGETYVNGSVLRVREYVDDSYMARFVNDANYYRLPLKTMILGLFMQPDSHYDVGKVITRKGPTLEGVNPTAVPGQMVISLDNWNCKQFPLHKAIGLTADWKKRGAISALCVTGFREAPFTREIFRSRTYTSIDRDYWETRRREDAYLAEVYNRPPIWTP